MKKPGNKAKSSKSEKKQKPLKASILSAPTKKVRAKKQVKKTTQKSKPAIDKIKPVETVTIKNIKADNARLTNQLKQKNRELKIEAALERVRARTMAMQRSEELADVATVLFQQVKAFNVPLLACGFNIWEPGDQDMTFYPGSPDGDILAPCKIPLWEHPVFIQFDESRKRGDELFILEKSGELQADHYRYMHSLKGGAGDMLQAMLNAGLQFPTFQIDHLANFSHGQLIFITYEHFPEMHEVFKRFAKVFEQTYTRFLGLQKAEAQTREANIEAALERVRSRSMAMHKSEELIEVDKIIIEQIKGLNIQLFAVGIHICHEHESVSDAWMGDPMEGGLFGGDRQFSKVIYEHTHDKLSELMYAGWKEGKTFLVETIQGESLKEHIGYMMTIVPDPTIFENAAPPEFLIYHLAYFSQGFFVFVSTSPCLDEHPVFIRFAKVFEQTYTRFLDLQKAEAQARESQIQLAMERVRARTMAMQRSEELPEVAALLFQQVKTLGVPQFHCGFNIFEIDDKECIWYPGSADGDILPPCKIPLTEHPVFMAFNESRKRGDELFVYEKEGEYQAGHYRYMLSLPVLGEILQNMLDAGIPFPTFQIDHLANFSHGNLLFITSEHFPEMHDTFKRFAKVFEQTYTRFLDLQKAEAQAREAKIEAALERVRSRTMAMHRSEEIADIVGKIFGELSLLDLVLNRVLIWIFNDEEKYIAWWSANPEAESNAESYRIDYNDQPVFLSYLQAWQKRKALYLYTLSGDIKKKWEDHLFTRTGLSKLPVAVKKGMREEGTIFTTSTISDYGLMMVGSFEPLSVDNTDIIQRFGRVFQQSYTRYLDVQKAEAQAREAKIEAALEKVRARTMAMQRSDELGEAASLLFKQIQSFGVSSFSCGFNIWEPDDISIKSYMANPDGTVEATSGLRLPHTEHPHFIQSYEARKRGEDFFVIETGGKELEDTYWYMFNIPEWEKVFGNWEDSGFPVPAFQLSHYVFFQQGYLLFITYQPVPEMWDIFKRFGKVFEQTYTRFLDLQKAEEQAREGQIELALERVRARAMGMYKAGELGEVLSVLFDQFDVLGITPMYTFLSLIDLEKNSFTYRQTGRGGKRVITLQTISLDASQIWKELADSYKAAQYDTVETMYTSKDQVAEVFDVFKETYDALPEGAKIFPEDFPDGIYTASATSRFGHLGYDHYRASTEEEKAILLRFNTEFTRVYQRFLDLQKAEAQARESQIQLSLERVRARTMAMQHSDELADASFVLDSQVRALGLKTLGCAFNIYGEGESTEWASSEAGIMPAYKTPRENVFLRYFEEGQKGMQLHIESFEGDALVAHYKYLSTIPAIGESLKKTKESGGSIPAKQIDHVAYFKYGYLLFITLEPVPEAHDIFIRFAKVFEQTYTRFHDLQKAEAQARESQIQLALERVRAKAIGMHHSGELSEVLTLLFQQYDFLDIHPVATLLNLFDIEKNTFTHFTTGKHGKYAMIQQTLQLDASETWRSLVEEWKAMQSQSISCLHYPVEVLPHVFELFKEMRAALPASDVVQLEDFPQGMFQTMANCKFGNIGFLHTREATEEEKDIVARFAREFERLYQRFLDLQKAEAQAREAQIEAALERVRSRTMAMQRSEELPNTALLMFQQLKTLGVAQFACSFNIWDEEKKASTCWGTREDGLAPPFKTFSSEDIFVQILEAAQRGDSLLVIEQVGEELETHYSYMTSIPEVKAIAEELSKAGLSFPTFQIIHCAFFSQGYLMFITYEPVPESHELFKRFAKVFEQTYTRFLDIQKAEAQAREAQIQLALERVRARTMAMQKSDELTDAASLLFKQIEDLGTTAWSSGFDIWLANEASATAWMANPDGSIGMPFVVPYTEDPFFKQIYAARQSGTDFFVMESSGKELEETYEYLFNLPDAKKHFDGVKSLGFQMPEFQITHCAFFSQGFLMFITYEPVLEMWDIFKRFAVVFEQTYTRFLDQQKAEAQAREAQIETALEKVRSRTMAMQRSEELAEVATVLFQQVKALGVPQWTCGFSIFEIDDKEFTWYPGSADGEILPSVKIPLTEHPVFISFNESRKRGDEFFVYEKEGEYQAGHYRYMMSLPGIRELLQKMLDAGFTFPTFQIDHLANFSHGNLVFITFEPVPEMHDVFKRFAKVFDQTYTRFLDLQKSEAQTREAQIEAALERVRSRTMAMQKSDELVDAADQMFQQIQALGVTSWNCGFNIWDEDKKHATSWNGTKGGLSQPFKTNSSEDVFLRFYEAAQRGETLYVEEIGGDECEAHYRYMATLPLVGDLLKGMIAAGISLPTFQIFHIAYFSQGYLMFITYEQVPQLWDIFKRFAKVFEQTYTRFLDLQKAEAQAREAIKQASVDRVRAEIASMRTTGDLERITPLIWNELKTLGVPFMRCGVFIIDEEQLQVHTFLSTPDGKANASFTSGFSTVSIITEALPYWRRKEMYKTHWDEATFKEQTNRLVEQGAVSATNTYLTENRPKNLHLHLLPFLQGILYVGNESPLNDDELQLVQNLADAFAIAYARYEDFNKLEAANNKIEKTLVDLKQTQSQLVQSEKMASLGELTAGIAHEIQNPLNFVNNFAEINNELIKELKNEVINKNLDEITSIANDIESNSEKINHHGKRAESIVKGMLQHSRKSTGIKEPTDINALADEYMRLSYHGLRAKDKSFNAEFKMDLDPTLPLVKVIPQDIGRVLLNLFNNAFWAVNERLKSKGDFKSPLDLTSYQPIVTLTTKNLNDNIEIRIHDNGPGIPPHIIDKIFQPFFTTKPTGQGTGLGLSLAYDIIKAHGGELNVKTDVGNGSEFIIQLPTT